MNAIIFDFDGTLADSFPVLLDIAHKMTQRPQLVDSAEVARLRKMPLIEVAAELKFPHWQWPFLIIRGRRKMKKRLHEVLPFAGIAEVVASLNQDGYKLYIISSNSTENVTKFLTQHGMSGYFQAVYGGVGLLGKARALRKLSARYKLSPDKTAYVGDEARDIVAAKAVGMMSVAVNWGFNDESVLAEQAPSVLVRHPEQLLNVLREWGNTL